MNTTIIQVPISKTLRNKALSAAISSGFSSLQDAIRVFLSQFAERKIDITFTLPPVKLSARNARRYDKMIEEIESGKVKPIIARNIKEFMSQLHAKNY